MQTERVIAQPSTVASVTQRAAEIIRRGGLVAFPTETVYGLGANALDATAVAKIYEAKGRASDNPLIVHIAHLADLDRVARDIPEAADKLMRVFWPGPVSLLMKKHPDIPDQVTGGLDTVVVRMPSHKVARALIIAAGTPIAAPSANTSGNVSATTADHVAADLGGRIDLIIDGGAVEYGLESTVIDCTTTPLAILRPGSISQDQIQAVIGPVELLTDAERPRSPGMKYRHYSPHTPLTLALCSNTPFNEWLPQYVDGRDTDRIALICHSEPTTTNVTHYPLPADPAAAAPLLFDTLRAADTDAVDEIIIEGWPEQGIGTAIMDRLRKAATRIEE